MKNLPPGICTMPLGHVGGGAGIATDADADALGCGVTAVGCSLPRSAKNKTPPAIAAAATANATMPAMIGPAPDRFGGAIAPGTVRIVRCTLKPPGPCAPGASGAVARFGVSGGTLG